MRATAPDDGAGGVRLRSNFRLRSGGCIVVNRGPMPTAAFEEASRGESGVAASDARDDLNHADQDKLTDAIHHGRGARNLGGKGARECANKERLTVTATIEREGTQANGNDQHHYHADGHDNDRAANKRE
jgi:hypothetical protein